jgi:hypothetical protein
MSAFPTPLYNARIFTLRFFFIGDELAKYKTCKKLYNVRENAFEELARLSQRSVDEMSERFIKTKTDSVKINFKTTESVLVIQIESLLYHGSGEPTEIAELRVPIAQSKYSECNLEKGNPFWQPLTTRHFQNVRIG